MEKNNSSGLPEGWIPCTLGDVSVIKSGIGFPIVFQGNKSGKYPFFKVGDISKLVQEGKKWLKTANNYVSEEVCLKLNGKPFKKNTIVFAKIGEALKLNRRAILSQESLVDNNVMGLENNERIVNHMFLFYYFNTIQLQKFSRATTVPSIRKQDVENIVFPLSPLNEQKRIVSKIDELFSELEFIKQTLEKTEFRLDHYRHSLLKRIFNNIPKRVPLFEIAHINPNPEKGKFSDDLLVSFIPMKNVQEMTGKIDVSIIRKFKEVKKGFTFFEEGDLLFAKITPCMENGKIAIAKGLTNKIGFGSTEFHVIRFKNNEIFPKFYFWYLLQDEFRNTAQRNMKGTAGQLRVPTDYIKNILVPYASKIEQNKAIMEIEANITKINAQRELIIWSLKKIDQLKKSILKQAFEGKLIPQDPNDEPATLLLEKINKKNNAKKGYAK